MFTEDYIQRTLYISSRGLSRAGLVVLTFSLLSIIFPLYGTLLWELDSPGYIFKASNATIADYQSQRNGPNEMVTPPTSSNSRSTGANLRVPRKDSLKSLALSYSILV